MTTKKPTPIPLILLTACGLPGPASTVDDTLDLLTETGQISSSTSTSLDTPPASTEHTSSSTDTTTVAGDSTTTGEPADTATTAGADESGESSSTTAAERPDTCGDGIVQAPERCDDKNADDRDLCNNDCQTKLRVFVSQPIAGWALGDPDALCQISADQLDLGGTFRAWIGTTTGGGTGPAHTFTKDSGWYVMIGPDQQPIARGFEGLTHGFLEHAIDRDREGHWIDDDTPLAWTNVTSEGLPGPNDCQEWHGDGKGGAGFFYSVGAAWTSFDVFDCNTKARLFCFEQRED